jgi:trehalose 6-phosphate synthase
MNLVAKEFVAARDDEDGVLVLSKFTGAAVELRDALLINPYDVVGVAEAIHTGLEMSREERRERMERMRRQVMEYNIYMWAAKVLGDLRELRLEPIEGSEPIRLAPAIVREAEVPAEKLA